ncbi:hypothetical protein KC336_g68 [Hortaea werneckii]|nr:hypothetical protein KC336_g68 [Hortaea werneckii]
MGAPELQSLLHNNRVREVTSDFHLLVNDDIAASECLLLLQHNIVTTIVSFHNSTKAIEICGVGRVK